MKNGIILMIFIFMLNSFYTYAQKDSLQTETLHSDSFKIAEQIVDTLAENNFKRLPFVGTYAVPQKWGFIKNVPMDLWQMAKDPFKKKNWLNLSIVAGSSALLIWQDQCLLNGAKEWGRKLHINPDVQYKVAFKVGTTKILKLPKNINTAFYQLGEGGTSMLMAGALLAYGKIKHDNRSIQTASDLAETFISMGVATQLVKRAFGRQSPFMSTQSGGRWLPFPSFSNYQKHTPQYDAFPSGHLATLMASVTVLTQNYPEKNG